MNSTLTSETSGHIDMAISTLSYLQANLALYRPELELLWTLLTYAPFLPKTMQYTSGTFSRARKFPYIPILVHILTGPMLVLRYHARFAATRTWPRPDASDLALFALFDLTSVILESSRSKQHYNTPSGRAGFQAAILIQTIVFGASWLQGRDPVLFRASIKLFNWFASFRYLLQWADWINPSLQKNFPLKWSTTVILSGTSAMWEADIPGGVPVFLGSVAMLMVVERAIAENIYDISDRSPLKRLVLAAGYVDYNHLEEKARQADEMIVAGQDKDKAN